MPQTVGVLSILQGELQNEVRRLWRLFETEYAARGVQSFHYPNLTFQAGGCHDVALLEKDFSDLAQHLQPFQVMIDGLDCFPASSKVVFLRVQVTEDLRHIHQIVNDWLGQHCDNLFERYLPERWIPHVTVAMQDLSDDDFKRAMHDLRDYHPHYEQTLSNLNLVQVSDQSGHIQIIQSARLD